MCRVYSSTNQTLFTEGQNSILNWVLKLNPLKQQKKSNETCLDYLERALFILFLPLAVINDVKRLHKMKKKKDLKKEEIKSPNDAWKGYLKTWGH